MNGPILIDIIEAYLHALNNNRMISITGTWQSAAAKIRFKVQSADKMQCENAYDVAVKTYNSSLSSIWDEIRLDHKTRLNYISDTPLEQPRNIMENRVSSVFNADYVDKMEAAHRKAVQEAETNYDQIVGHVGQIGQNYRNKLHYYME